MGKRKPRNLGGSSLLRSKIPVLTAFAFIPGAQWIIYANNEIDRIRAEAVEYHGKDKAVEIEAQARELGLTTRESFFDAFWRLSRPVL